MFNTELVPAITSEEALNYLKIWQVSYNQLNNPEIDFSGWWKDEAEVRNKPGLFFLQVSEGYWKGLTFVRINNGWFPAGYCELITLQDLNNQSLVFSQSLETNGEVAIIFDPGKGGAVDSRITIGNEVGLQVVASNFDAIETVKQSDFNKFFKSYCNDWTQGPFIVTKYAFMSMVLLHVLNCAGNISPFPSQSPLNEFIEIQNLKKQMELNLLKKFGIFNSAGYVESGLQESFSNKTNDENFAAICVRHSPAVTRFNFGKKIPFEEICLGNLFIYASLSNSISYCKALTNLSPLVRKECIKANLRRYYKSVLLYAKLNKSKTVCAPFLGSGEFKVPLLYHSEVLNELEDVILNSGVTLIINAFEGKDSQNNHVQETNWPKSCVSLYNVNGRKSFAEVVNILMNPTFT
jgi:hypothetical protein